MKLKYQLIIGAAMSALFFASFPALAHHAFSAEFDGDKPIEVKGIVTKLELTNPHSWLYLDVKGPDGKVTNWGFEFGAPFSLKEKGVTKKTFAAGTEVTVSGFRAKSGKEFGYAVTTTLADGRSFKTGGAQDAPTAPAADAATGPK
jgi:hypothetical protein